MALATLTVTEGLMAIAVDSDGIDSTNIIETVRDMQAKVLDRKVAPEFRSKDGNLNTGEWIILHAQMTSDEVDLVLMDVFN